MQNAGLVPLVDFEDLPVSGFGDVLPKYRRLRKSFKILEKALHSKDCVGLVAIDYPGFNMKLVGVAKKLGKPIYYVAPPQIWAWKSHRAKMFVGYDKIQLAVFFDFEAEAYRKAGCDVVKVSHPYAEMVNNCGCAFLKYQGEGYADKILLLPGSRKSQALRNIPVFLDVVKKCVEKNVFQNKKVVVLAARDSLIPEFEKSVDLWMFTKKIDFEVSVMTSPRDAESRGLFYGSSFVAVSAPGTATLELALAGCPSVVCTKPDFLTACFAKLSVKTKYFALPNLILDSEVFPEFILEKRCCFVAEKIAEAINKMTTNPPPFQKMLLRKLQTEKKSETLMSEFFAQFF